MYEELFHTVDTAIDSTDIHLRDVSSFLWNNPELALKEVLAHDKITEFLVNQGFHVQPNQPTSTAFLATWPATIDKTPESVHGGFMCEYDALPGIGHACGHNLIAIVALGAGYAVKAVLEKYGKDEDHVASILKKCRVTIFGTPAEEAIGGKIDHIKAGNLNQLDFALMAHPSNVNSSKPRYLACKDLTATFTGLASHASENPSGGLNALDAAVLAYQSLSCMRQQFEPGWQAHAIITKGGNAPNIIPNLTELQYMLRSSDKYSLLKLEARINDVLMGAAQSAQCQIKIEPIGYAYDNILQNNIIARIYEEQCIKHDSQIVPKTKENVSDLISNIIKIDKARGSTDMGNVSYVTPSLHPEFKIGCSACVHTTNFATAANSDLAHWAAIRQAKILARTCVQLMLDSNLLSKTKTQFEQDIHQNQQ